jgi:hypothetical protein
MRHAYADPIAQAAIDRLEAENAELRAKVAAVEALANAMSVSCHYMLAIEAPERIRAALRQAKP